MVILLLAFTFLTLFLFSYQKDEKRFTNITSRLFTEEMISNTLNMHYTIAFPSDFGICEYDPVLPGYCADASRQGQISLENTLASLKSLNRNKLEASDAWLHRLLVRYLENSLTLSSFSYYNEPLSPSSGMQSQLPILLAEYTFRSKRDVEDYLSLLEQTDQYFASLLLYEQEKADAGLLMPASSLQSGTHFLQTTFRERLESLTDANLITPKEAQKYINTNDRLLKTVLLPAYTALGDGLLILEDESVPLTGLAAFPRGKEYYESLLISETGSYRSVSQIQELLTTYFTREFETLRALLSEHPEIAQKYSNDESVDFPYENAAQMLTDLKGRMTGNFPAVPGDNCSVSIKAVSQSLSDYCAPAFYLTTPLDDTTWNVIYINEPKTPKGLELYTTLAHEGYPGHLYQNIYHNRTDLSRGERPVKELLWYGGYLEGWALYVEFMSYDYASAMLQENNRGQDALWVQTEKHNRSLQLCLYSLLDIMIHYENASYSQVAKVLEKFGIDDSSSVRAIYTYIVQEPCNYLKYYLGYLEILSLRERARSLWGDDYSDYRFHCFYLDNGPADFLSLNELLTEVSP